MVNHLEGAMGAVVVDAMSLLLLPRSFAVSPSSSSSSSSSSPSSSHLRFLSTNCLAPHLRAPFLRLRISNGGRAIRSVVCTSVPNSSENYNADSSKSPSQEAAFDIKLPRRSLMVQFTCDSCGERTKRLINRVAYEKGTVFIQCAGCLVYHKFVDNLGLVVEYDLREEHDVDSDGTD
ncbi:Mitochondrial protein import protein ZIM17 [Ananas comosus]|uniref:Mitochondrial protein import protein ZIM17 n=1 Tax=Ananas comosus TaxID=4615 RepID=A0A199VRY2_ANACO|nr:Mitochondrial protein import protein ZIM17 [Ananas comosus]